MDAVGETPQWPGTFPGLAGPGRDSRSRGLLERTEALHRDAAARLRGMGWEDLARRADKFARWVRFDLDEPRAARRHTQTVIADVTTDPGFASHRAIVAASGFRAVQSTALLDREGRLVGVVSTHYPHPRYWLPRERGLMQRYGELAGWFVADRVTASPGGPAAEADRHRAERAEGPAVDRQPASR